MREMTTVTIRANERDAMKRVQQSYRLRHLSDALRGLIRCHEMLTPEQRKSAMYDEAEIEQQPALAS
jgi:hypothetical protein